MILYLGNKLSAHGFTPTSVETLGKKISELNFEVVTKSSFKNKILRIADMLFSVVKLRNRNPVVLIDTYSTSAFWFAYASAKLCSFLSIPYIPILRGGDLPLRIASSKNASETYFRNSFANVAVSGFMLAEFSKRQLPVQMIHNYLELEKYPFTKRQNIRPKLLWVRSFHKIYNPHLALKVLKQLSLSYPNASLCMVGPDKDGTMNECRQRALELNLDVTFTGRLSKEEWTSLSKEYDVFINTTDVDNTPISVMEAMALGMPVVTTNAGGIPFLFKDGTEGVMVNKNDEMEMTAAIMSLLSSPEKTQSISEAARLKSLQWDWKVVGPQWKSLIDNAIKLSYR